MKTLLATLCLFLAVPACAKPAAPKAAKVVKGLATNGGSFKFVRGPVTLHEDGSMTVALKYVNAVTGKLVADKTLIIPGDPSKAVLDGASSEPVAPGSVAFQAARVAYEAQLDSMFKQLADSGKLHL